MAPLYAAVIEAVRHIREEAMLEVMAMCHRLQPEGDPVIFRDASDEEIRAFRVGHQKALIQLYTEIERMIARAPAPTAQAGYTSDGIEDGC